MSIKSQFGIRHQRMAERQLEKAAFSRRDIQNNAISYGYCVSSDYSKIEHKTEIDEAMKAFTSKGGTIQYL